LHNQTQLRPRICILVHGLVDDESTWSYNEGDYGMFLERDLNVSPFYLRYNTGLHVSTNRHKLSLLIQALLQTYPVEIQDITFVCHSMGGLVTRSALHYGVKSNLSWTQAVARVMFLGAPHQGSPWEKMGNILSSAFGSVPRPYMKLAERVVNLRSSGIKDLRYGYILEEDWQGENPDALWNNTKKKTLLLDWISYYNITGTRTANPSHPLAFCMGGALVRKPSAEGYSDSAEHHLNFPREHCYEFAGIRHTCLSKDPAIYEQIKIWMEESKELSNNTERRWNRLEATSDHRDEYTAHPPRHRSLSDVKGVVTLVQDAVEKGTTAVKGVHMELTDETFDRLSKIPSLSKGINVVRTIHDVTIGTVYDTIRVVNDGTGTVVKRLFLDKAKDNFYRNIET